MSLIVFVSTEAGVVVVGDRAMTGSRAAIGAEANMAGGPIKLGAKTFAFDSNTVFGVTGIPTVGFLRDDGHRIPAFDAPSLIVGYGKAHPYGADDDAFWDGLSTAVIGQLMAKAPPGQAWKPPADGFIFQAMFAHVPRDNSTWTYRCLRFSVAFDGATTRIIREVVPHPMPSIRAIGNDLVYLELLGGTDPRFDDVRAEPIFRLAQERAFNGSEAVLLAKRICAVTSERRLLLEKVDTGHNVSAETDGWIVKTNGWKRLYKNKL